MLLLRAKPVCAMTETFARNYLNFSTGECLLVVNVEVGFYGRMENHEIWNPKSENGTGTGTGIRELKIEDVLKVLLTIIDFARLFFSICYIYFVTVAFSSSRTKIFR